MNLDAESELFERAVKKGKGESLGIKLSMDWELDKITLCLTDKNDGCIASLDFDNTDFQGMAEKVIPSVEDMEEQKDITQEEKKELEKDIEQES